MRDRDIDRDRLRDRERDRDFERRDERFVCLDLHAEYLLTVADEDPDLLSTETVETDRRRADRPHQVHEVARIDQDLDLQIDVVAIDINPTGEPLHLESLGSHQQ